MRVRSTWETPPEPDPPLRPPAKVRYIVIRPRHDLPEGFLPDYWDGRWLDVEELRPFPLPFSPGDMGPTAAAVATGRYESRDDGAIAEVYEVQPARSGG